MNWTSINLSDITTYNPIYFNKSRSEECKRICKLLYIDCFPELDSISFQRLVEDTWIKKPIEYSLAGIDSAFDERLLELFEKNDSNIVFTVNQEFIDGIIHFTNYETPNVYSKIYHNLNVFEKNLRSHLFDNGLTDRDFIEYLEVHKLKLEKKESRREFLQRRILELKNSRDKRPFENTYLNEIIEFSTSSYHSPEFLNVLGTQFLKEKISLDDSNSTNVGRSINDLRNFIMHHDNLSGESVFTPHNFNEFKKFFVSVRNFKDAFERLRKERLGIKLPKLKRTNELRLDIVSKLNDSDLIDYFYQ